MIARILPSTSFNKVIEYHYKKIEEGTGKNLTPMLKDIEKKEALKYINEPSMLREKIKGRKKLSNEPLFHVSLSLNHDEKIDDLNFLDVAQDYMEAMGFKEHNMLYFRHDDTDHTHIHVVCNRIDMQKFNVTLKSFERLNSMNISRRLEKKHGLKETLYSKGKDMALDKDQQNREGVLAKLKVKVDQAIDKSYSLQSYKEALLNNGISLHIKELNGKTKAGYRFKYYGKTHYFHSTNVGRDINPLKIIDNFSSRDDKKAVKNIVNGILNRFEKVFSLTDLRSLLYDESISLKIHRYQDGKVYGKSFQINGQEIKGSDVGIGWEKLKEKLLSDRDSDIDNEGHDREGKYNVLSGQGHKTKGIPPITATELNSYKKEIQSNYFNHYTNAKKHYCLNHYIEGLKGFGIETITEGGLIKDLKINNIEFSTIGLGISKLNQLFEKNIEKELYNCCPKNDLGYIERYLEQTLGTEVLIKDGTVKIFHKEYPLQKYGLIIPKGIKPAKGSGKGIFRSDQSQWHFEDMDEKNKRRNKRKNENLDNQDNNIE